MESKLEGEWEGKEKSVKKVKKKVVLMLEFMMDVNPQNTFIYVLWQLFGATGWSDYIYIEIYYSHK